MTTTITSYVNSCRASGCTTNTLNNYQRILEAFAAWVEDSGLCAQKITPADIVEYKVHLADRGLKQSTIQLHMTTLRLFYAWQVEVGRLDATPCTASATKTKVPPRKSYDKLLTRAEIAQLLKPERPAHIYKNTWSMRYAIVCILLTSGMRNAELRELRTEDLDFTGGTIHIRSGKGDKERWAAFPPIARSAVLQFLAERPKDLPEGAPLFGTGERWNEITQVDLSKMVEVYVRAAIGREGIHTHALRHSSASLMFDADMSIEDIADLLGHASPVTTRRIYIDRLRPEKPVDAAANAFEALLAGA